MDNVEADWQQIPDAAAQVLDQESASISDHPDLATQLNHHQHEEESIPCNPIIRENYMHIDSFPPNHHEGLPISVPHSPPPPPLHKDDEPSSMIKAISGVFGFAARLYGVSGVQFWKVASVVGAAAFALVYVKKKKMMQRWWWRTQKKGTAVVVEDKFRQLIKERDKVLTCTPYFVYFSISRP